MYMQLSGIRSVSKTNSLDNWYSLNNKKTHQALECIRYSDLKEKQQLSKLKTRTDQLLIV